MQSLSPTYRLEPAGNCAHRVLDSVPPVIWFIRRQMRAHRKGLSLPQFRTLSAVDREPALSLSGLADHLGASLPTASRIVTGLVNKRLLMRKECRDDRRQLALAITPAGSAVLAAAWESTHAEMEKRLGGLSTNERLTLIAAMDILRGLFGAVGLPRLAPNGRRARPAAGEYNPRRPGRRRMQPRAAAAFIAQQRS